jgi:hypothetical protein
MGEHCEFSMLMEPGYFSFAYIYTLDEVYILGRLL